MQKFTRQIGLKRDHGQRMPEHVMYIAGDALALADHVKLGLGFVGVFTQLDQVGEPHNPDHRESQ